MKMERMNMNQLRSLAKERNLRGYSRLRKVDLIKFLRENEPIVSIEQPLIDDISGTTMSTLTKRQLKHRRYKAS